MSGLLDITPKKYTLNALNYSRIPNMIKGIFLNQGILESLGPSHFGP